MHKCIFRLILMTIGAIRWLCNICSVRNSCSYLLETPGCASFWHPLHGCKRVMTPDPFPCPSLASLEQPEQPGTLLTVQDSKSVAARPRTLESSLALRCDSAVQSFCGLSAHAAPGHGVMDLLPRDTMSWSSCPGGHHPEHRLASTSYGAPWAALC